MVMPDRTRNPSRSARAGRLGDARDGTTRVHGR